jgi:hypothetical protein
MPHSIVPVIGCHNEEMINITPVVQKNKQTFASFFQNIDLLINSADSTRSKDLAHNCGALLEQIP